MQALVGGREVSEGEDISDLHNERPVADTMDSGLPLELGPERLWFCGGGPFGGMILVRSSRICR